MKQLAFLIADRWLGCFNTEQNIWSMGNQKAGKAVRILIKLYC